jgi:hypothetical protein
MAASRAPASTPALEGVEGRMVLGGAGEDSVMITELSFIRTGWALRGVRTTAGEKALSPDGIKAKGGRLACAVTA